jgi:tricorn protease-like protein
MLSLEHHKYDPRNKEDDGKEIVFENNREHYGNQCEESKNPIPISRSVFRKKLRGRPREGGRGIHALKKYNIRNGNKYTGRGEVGEEKY